MSLVCGVSGVWRVVCCVVVGVYIRCVCVCVMVGDVYT